MGRDNPNKNYKVGEVSQMLGIESYILRYWEKVFPQLNPLKDENGQRVYTETDISTVKRIKDLLHEERYTIDGAKKRLKGENNKKQENLASNSVQEIQDVLNDVKNILQDILIILEKD